MDVSTTNNYENLLVCSEHKCISFAFDGNFDI